jgi:hypothetical protein
MAGAAAKNGCAVERRQRVMIPRVTSRCRGRGCPIEESEVKSIACRITTFPRDTKIRDPELVPGQHEQDEQSLPAQRVGKGGVQCAVNPWWATPEWVRGRDASVESRTEIFNSQLTTSGFADGSVLPAVHANRLSPPANLQTLWTPRDPVLQLQETSPNLGPSLRPNAEIHDSGVPVHHDQVRSHSSSADIIRWSDVDRPKAADHDHQGDHARVRQHGNRIVDTRRVTSHELRPASRISRASPSLSVLPENAFASSCVSSPQTRLARVHWRQDDAFPRGGTRGPTFPSSSAARLIQTSNQLNEKDRHRSYLGDQNG